MAPMHSVLSPAPKRLFFSLALLGLGSPAFADLDPVDPLDVLEVRTLSIAGKDYLEVSALMNGRISVIPAATYRVPVTVLFAEDPVQQSGTALVDCLNNTLFRVFFDDLHDESNPHATPAVPPVAVARTLLGDGFFASRGDTYVAVQHDKQAIDRYVEIGSPLVHGAYIESLSGQNVVIADVSDLLKNPPAALLSLQPAQYTIAFGESASATDLTEHFFKLDFPSSYDGALLQSARGLGSGPPPPDKKFIVVNTETDVQVFGAEASRPGFQAPPNYRVFEVAGTAHNPIEQIPIGELALAFDPAYLATIPFLRQSPAPISPVIAAMYDHMRVWVAGGPPPPPSVFLAGPLAPKIESLPNSAGESTPIAVTDPLRDRDGNALGGVRLPHVRTVVNGKPVGAPLGTLNGVERDVPFDARGFGVMISGSFEVFPPDVLTLRYPTQLNYVLGVKDAAQHAFARGWITAQDRDAYVQAAVECAPAVNAQATYEVAVDCMNL